MASNLLILLFCCGLSFWGELDFGNPYISLSRWKNDVPEALQTAILDGNLPRVKELVQLGISVQAQNMYWESPLYLAIQSDREDIYAFLLQHGATLYIDDIELNQNETGIQYTPLIEAIGGHYNNIAKYIIEQELQTRYDTIECQIRMALLCENYAILKFLLARDPKNEHLLDEEFYWMPLEHQTSETLLDFWNSRMESLKDLKNLKLISNSRYKKIKRRIEQQIAYFQNVLKRPVIPIPPDPNRPPPLE